MTEFDPLLTPTVETELEEMERPGERTIRHKLRDLADDPFPDDVGHGASELPFGGEHWYYYDVGRGWRLYYAVRPDEEAVVLVNFERPSEGYEKFGF